MIGLALEKHYKLSEVAEVLGSTVHNIRYHVKQGHIQTVQTPGGHHRVSESELMRLLGKPVKKKPKPMECIIYARVSSRKQQKAGHLQLQVERLQEFATARGYTIRATITDIGSGLSEKRRGLLRILKQAQSKPFQYLVIEFPDRLTRFGFLYLETFFQQNGIEIIVKEENPQRKNIEKELLEDLLSLVYSFAGKLYGYRSAKFRKIKACLKQELNPARKPNNTPDNSSLLPSLSKESHEGL